MCESEETTGQRIARIRKERGYTQNELAERIGTIQALVSDYERDKLRLNAEMAVRFAIALEVLPMSFWDFKPPTARGWQRATAEKPAAESFAVSKRSNCYRPISKPSCLRLSTLSSKLPPIKSVIITSDGEARLRLKSAARSFFSRSK